MQWIDVGSRGFMVYVLAGWFLARLPEECQGEGTATFSVTVITFAWWEFQQNSYLPVHATRRSPFEARGTIRDWFAFDVSDPSGSFNLLAQDLLNYHILIRLFYHDSNYYVWICSIYYEYTSISCSYILVYNALQFSEGREGDWRAEASEVEGVRCRKELCATTFR